MIHIRHFHFRQKKSERNSALPPNGTGLAHLIKIIADLKIFACNIPTISCFDVLNEG